MKDNKYYTPEISEFHIGFEYEALNSRDWFFSESEYGWEKMKWEPRIGSHNQGIFEIDRAIQEGWIRVPYLSKEDIEAEGWEFKGQDEEYPCDVFSKSIKGNTWQIQSWSENQYSFERFDAIGKTVHFVGKIKNASEFKRVLKMIGA